jgi:TolA-binding protein
MTHVACLLTAFLPTPAWADRIQLKDGKVMDGVKVVSISWKEVEVEGPTGRRRFGMEEVEEVRGSVDAGYWQARAAEQAGRFDEAIGYYRELKKRSGVPDWVAQEGAFREGGCLERQGKWAEAASVYEVLERGASAGRFAAEALLRQAICRVEAGAFDQALGILGRLEASFGEEGHGRYAHEASFWKGWAQERKGALEEAARTYENVFQRGRSRYPSLALRARIRQARVWIRGGKWGEARSVLEELDQGEGGLASELRGVFFNAWGDWYRSKAAGEKDPETSRSLWLEGVIAYLKGGVLYPDGGSEEAEALEGAAGCFEGLKETERARVLRQELKQRFPGYE